MLAKQKKNMFISFRNDPRDMESIRQEIRLNMRRGLARLQCNSKTKNSNEPISASFSELAIEDLTSKDIYKDMRSHYRAHEWKMRDIIYMKKWWKAICGNSHLFKDKVSKKNLPILI